MKKKKITVSSKYVVGINEFLFNYVLYGKEDKEDLKRKLTHNYMMEYLYENNYAKPERKSFSRISSEDILMGEVLFVEDETGRILPYKNPLRINLELLKIELNSVANQKRALAARKNYLQEQGLVETRSGEVIDKKNMEDEEEKITSKINRVKTLSNKNARKMRGTIGL